MKWVLTFVFTLSFILISLSVKADDYRIGVFYHPGWHYDSRMIHGEHWGEGCNCSYENSPWYPNVYAEKFFDDQIQPIEPWLGYYDDTNISVLEKEIEWANSYGVDFFAFNWYWFEGKQLYQEPLEDAFLKAQNRNKLDFVVHWIFGETVLSDWIRPNYTEQDILNASDYIITNYFNESNYLKINEKPVIMIMNLHILMDQFGVNDLGIIFQKMRQLSVDKGYNDLFLIAVGSKENVIGSLKEIEFDAFTDYHYGRFFGEKNILSGFMPWYGWYDDVIDLYEEYWQNFTDQGRGEGGTVADIPYIIPLTPGVDTTPWHKEMGTVIRNSTPDKFEIMLEKGKDFIDNNQLGLDKKTLIIEAWNEWGEGAVLEPEKHYGFGYLESVKNIFYEVTEGDVDKNGVVNIQDLVIISSNLGKTEFDPILDVVPNGEIDIYDLVFVASKFT